MAPPGNRTVGSDPDTLFKSALDGDKVSLARMISLIERGGEPAVDCAKLAFPLGGRAYTVGITGAPGAGKSTLTDRLISRARTDGRVAVLAIDPSSPFSGGAILGDRVRMGEHSADPDVYIRSMATRGHLGGLALAVPETVRLLDAVGFPTVIIETVGVGQVEVEIAGAADTTCVIVTPGWGDSVQAAKAGLMEIADVFGVNKADRPGVKETVRDLEAMLDLAQGGAHARGHAPAEGADDHWRPPIATMTATNNEGIDDFWSAICDHRRHLEKSGQLEARRQARLADELTRIVARRLEERTSGLWSQGKIEHLMAKMLSRELDPYGASEEVLRSLLG